MKQLIYSMLACIVLTACAGNAEIFHFNSNANNVQVTVDEQSCTTPCQLELEPREEMLATITYDQKFAFYMKADKIITPPSDESSDTSSGNSFSGVNLGGFGGDGGDDLAALLLLSTTTTTTVVTTYIAVEATEANQAPVVYLYDTHSYYIYIRELGSSYALYDHEFTDYALQHFDSMQQELFYTDKPFIDAFKELSGLPNVEGLLLVSEDALTFLDNLTLEKVKQILDSNIDESEKVFAISALLWYDKAALESYPGMYSDNFLKDVSYYLKAKRTPLVPHQPTNQTPAKPQARVREDVFYIDGSLGLDYYNDLSEFTDKNPNLVANVSFTFNSADIGEPVDNLMLGFSFVYEQFYGSLVDEFERRMRFESIGVALNAKYTFGKFVDAYAMAGISAVYGGIIDTDDEFDDEPEIDTTYGLFAEVGARFFVLDLGDSGIYIKTAVRYLSASSEISDEPISLDNTAIMVGIGLDLHK